MINLIGKAQCSHRLRKEEIVRLLSAEAAGELLAAADEVRRRYVGDAVHLRALIEFSNQCGRNCFYCGLRCENDKISRYRLDSGVVVELARKAKQYGFRTVVLQSGEDDFFSVSRMVELIGGIKELGMALTLSIGEKSRAEYQAYKAAGADRFLLRIETTDRALYERYHPGMNYVNRVRCLYDLKDLGFEVGSGSLVGLPGQSVASLADDLLFFQELDVDMAGIGPFVPNPDTPLAGYAGCSPFVIAGTPVSALDMSLRMMAVARLLLPDCNIPATTAMETLHPEGRIRALRGGANVVMPNVTEGAYRNMYALYPGKACVDDAPDSAFRRAAETIYSIGRRVGEGYGFRTVRQRE